MPCTKDVDDFCGRVGSCPIADHRVEFVVRTQTLRRRRETRIAEQVPVAPSPRPCAPSRCRHARSAPPTPRRRRSGRRLGGSRGGGCPRAAARRAFIEYSITGSAVMQAATSIWAISISCPTPVRRRCSSAASSATPACTPTIGIGGPLQVARRPVGVAGDRRHAGGLLEVQRPADVVAPRALQAEPRHPDHDHVRLQLYQGFVVQAELLDHAGREVLHDDVGVADEPTGDATAAFAT